MNLKRPPVGILGGGQLARMLAEAAHRLGLEPFVLTKSLDDPAAQNCRSVQLGSIHLEQDVAQFFQSVQLATLESEFVSCDLLSSALKKKRIEFFPTVASVRSLQSKWRQKELLVELKIPTSKAVSFGGENVSGLDRWISNILKTYRGEAVIKWAELGYDGKGTFFLNEGNVSEAVEFCTEALKKRAGLYAEQKIPFRRELAMVAVRGRTKEFKNYPLVISEQKNGICHKVLGPATSLGVPKGLETKAAATCKKIMTALDYVGAMGVEFFETKSGLLVNEIAPRVHNTGHYTQDACRTSQFENHWRAVLEMPLGDTTANAKFFGMKNLLGPMTESFPLQAGKLAEKEHIHWYGKKDDLPGRKMGHINYIAGSKAELLKLMR